MRLGIVICLMALCSGVAAEENADEQAPEFALGSPGEKHENLLFDIRKGRFRVELEGMKGIDSGSVDRTDDLGVKGTIEYEVPLVKHLTFSARAMPLFVYREDLPGDDETVGAFGLGPVFRVYSDGRNFRKFFFEVGISAIVQTSNFERNSGLVNFLSEDGVGDMLKNDMHVSATVQHISNAGLADDNSGVNLIGVGVGYSFRPGQFRARRKERSDE